MLDAALRLRAATEETYLCREEARVWLYHQLQDLATVFEGITQRRENDVYSSALHPYELYEMQGLALQAVRGIGCVWDLLETGVLNPFNQSSELQHSSLSVDAFNEDVIEDIGEEQQFGLYDHALERILDRDKA